MAKINKQINLTSFELFWIHSDFINAVTTNNEGFLLTLSKTHVLKGEVNSILYVILQSSKLL